MLAIETSNPGAVPARAHAAAALGPAAAVQPLAPGTHAGHGPSIALGELIDASGAPWNERDAAAAEPRPVAARVLGVEPVAPASRHADDLTPALQRLSQRVGVEPGRIAVVAVSVGPGGFTALRMATATGAMIAWATGAACVALPTSVVAAQRWFMRGRTRTDAHPAPEAHAPRLAVALAGKHDTVHLTALAAASPHPRVLDARVLAAADVASWIGAHRVEVLLADEHLPAPVRTAVLSAGTPIDPLALEAESCLHAAASWPRVPAHALVPFYAREPEAVTLWRARHGPARA